MEFMEEATFKKKGKEKKKQKLNTTVTIHIAREGVCVCV